MSLYMEFVGGLGDALLRIYFSAAHWYCGLDRLDPEERAKVVLMSHSPYLSEIFRWHPKRNQIDVLDLGFTTPFHPWENKEWRVAHGLPPEGPCPPHGPAPTLRFYPAPTDEPLLARLSRERFLVLSATASSAEKSIPPTIRQEAADLAIRRGFKILVVGRRHYFRDGRSNDIEISEGVIDAVDHLTVPGTVEAVKLSAGVITAHSAALHMAWSEDRPVFLLYSKEIKRTVLPCGPVGYMQGMNRPDADHMEFSEYSQGRFLEWLRGR